jgi:ketosteroid isomerase-like protein
MPRFDQQTAVDAIELQQLVADWSEDLDLTGGATVTKLCTDDCTYMLGGTPHTGHAAISAFYAARNERVRTQQKDGIRTQRHALTNLRVTFKGADNAEGKFLVVNYSAEGPAPALNLVGPTIVADARMEFRRETDGEWRISLFDSTPVFVGNDPFLNASVVKK